MKSYQIKRFILRIKWLLIGIALFLYFRYFRTNRPEIPGIRDLDIFITIGFLGYILARAEIDRCKAGSGQFISNPLHTSIGAEPFQFKDSDITYLLFRIGGFRSEFWNWKGNDGAIIAPAYLTKKEYDNYACHAEVYDREIEELPIEAQNYIISNDIPPPYKEAVFPDNVIKRNDDYQKIHHTLAKYRSIVTKQNEVIDENFKRVEAFTSISARITQAHNKQPSKIFGFGGGGNV